MTTKDNDKDPSTAGVPAAGVAVPLGQTMPKLDRLPVLTESTLGAPREAAGGLPVVAVTGGNLGLPVGRAAAHPAPPGLPKASAPPAAAQGKAAARIAAMAPAARSKGGSRLSVIAEGLCFAGNAYIDGSITVSGEVRGDLELAADQPGVVTVTESGHVIGDIQAQSISVLGRTAGTLDAAGGKVSLHDSAVVSGRIRYAHLQVNGADLNAQLERVRNDEQGS